MSSTETDDLKTQLKDIQDRLVSTAHLGQALQSAEMELSQHIKQLESGNSSEHSTEITEALQSKLNNLQQTYSGLMIKKPNSKSVNKREDAHAGPLAPSKRHKNQLSQSHSAEDVAFASTLSEQFLVEARRMREELHNKDRQLEEQAAERDQLRNESKELRTIVTDLKANEERIKDENWNLELRLQELDSKVSKSDVAVAKMSGQSRQLASQEEAHIDQIETLRAHADDLKRELDQMKGKHEIQASNWRKEKEELNQDNTSLHKSLTELKQELANASSVIANLDNDENPRESAVGPEISTDEEFETPTNSPPLSPMNQTPAQMSVLENETMKKSLQHTHRQIATLKTGFLKERSEKSELKRQIAQLQEDLNRAKSAPSNATGSTSSNASNVIRTKRSKFFARQNAAVKRAEATLGRNAGSGDSMSAQSSTESEAAFETAQEDAAITTNTEDDAFHTVGEESSGGETETEQDRTVNASRFYNLEAANESTASLSSGSEGEKEEENLRRFASNRRSIRMKRSSKQVNAGDSRETTAPRSLADELLPIDDVKKQAALHGLVTLTQEENQTLLSRSINDIEGLNADDLQQAAAVLNYTAIPLVEYNTLKSHEHDLHDPKVLTESILPSMGFVALSSAEYTKLLNPATDTLKNQVSKIGHKMISSEDYENLHNPSSEKIVNIANSRGLSVVPNDEYEKLVNPSKSDVERYAETHNLKAIPIEDHEKLVHESTRPRTREEVESSAKNHELVAVPIEVYQHLKQLEDQPTTESIQNLADKIDLKVIDNQTFDKWSHPTAEFITSQAASHGLTTIEASKYKDMTRALTSPSSEELTEKATNLGLQVLPISEYRELLSPNRQKLQEMADGIHAVVVDHDEYETTKQLATNPPEEHMIEIAKKRDFVAIPEHQWLQMKTLAEQPDEDHIKSKAISRGLAVVPDSHLKSLEQRANEPSMEEIEKHASAKQMLLITQSDHDKFTSPSLDDLSKHSAAHGHKLISEKSLDALNNPSKEDIEARAKDLGLVVLESTDYNELKTHKPTQEELETRASELGHVVVEKEKFDKLSEDANIVIDKSFVTSAAASVGLSVLGHDELAKLKETPSLDAIKNIASKSGHTIVSASELDTLRNPSVDKATEICRSNNLVVIPSSEHKELLKPYEPQSSEEIKPFAEKFGLVTIPEKTYSELTAEPTEEKILKEAQNFGLVGIKKDEYEELSSRPKEFNPTLDELQKHAANQKQELISAAELHELQHPSKDRLTEIGTQLGFKIVPSSEYEELKRKTINPSSSELETLAAGLGLTVLPLKQVQDLHERTSNPTKDHVREAAAKIGYSALPDNELNELRKKATAPTLDQLRDITNQYGHVLVSQADHDELKRSVEEPTAEELRFQADKSGYVLVDKDTYDELEKNATDPDDETLSKFSKRKGMSLISSMELEDLKKTAHHPTKEQIEQFAKRMGLSVIPIEQYAALFEREDGMQGFDDYDSSLQLTKPLSAQDTGGSNLGGSPKNIHLQSVAFKRSHFEDMIRKAGTEEGSKPVDKKIVDSMRSLGYVPVAQEEYKRLLDNQQVYNPTKVEIIRAAKKFGLTAIAVEEYRSLLKRHPSNRESSASLENIMDAKSIVSPSSTIFSENARSSSKSPPGSPTRHHSRKSSSDIDMESVSVAYLNTLRRIAEHPTREDIELLARKAGVSLDDTSKEVHKSGDDDHKTSLEKVKSDAASFGLIPLTVTEHEELLQRQERPTTMENIMANARRMDIVPLTKEEYQSLNERAMKNESQTTLDDIKAQAETAGLITMTADEYRALSEIDAAKVENEAEKLGLVTVPKSVYENMQKPSLNEKDPRVQAGSFGLMTISEEELNKRVNDEVTKAKTQIAAEEKSKSVLTELTKNDINMQATRLGLTVLDTNEYNNQMKQQAAALAAARSRSLNPNREEVERQASLLGLMLMDSEEHKRLSNATLTGREGSIREVRRSTPLVMSPREISPPTFEPALEEHQSRGTQQSLANRNSLGSVSTESRYHTAAMERTGDTSFRSRRNVSEDANGSIMNLSAITIASQTSLTDRNMIPYISQIVIGEFLHKYTRQFGVSGISDNRHERYFWVHPYSLTLHWGKENPGSTMPHDLKTRSAAIKAVKSVDDANPLPPGLYHKSIIVTTNERQIKLTCPNRRRHNIWYNSLQYLIKRSTDDLNFEEDDIVDDYVEDRNMRAERARTASVMSRRSRNTTGNRILSIRRSVAPEMNSPTNRTLSMRSSGVPLDGSNSRPGTALSYRPPSLLPPNAV